MAVDAGTIFSEVRIHLDKLKGDIAAVEATLDKFGKTNQAEAAKTQKSWKDSFGEINLAGVAAFAGLALAVKASVDTFAQFEQSLANVRSVARATPEEFKRIEEAALAAGETTRFTASQAAEAMYSLASAGFDAAQTVDGLNGVLLLAGSTQSDLAFTSETLASAISQFNLEASDAERVANVFTAAINASQATMGKLAVSMRYVGPVAAVMNKSLEETTGVLSILFNKGFEASQAGTALRSTLADLSNASSPAVAKLRELGVSFDEVNPQTNSFADIVDVLNKKVDIATFGMQIFGERAGPAMVALVGEGRAEIEKYTAAVTGTNAAAEAYATQNDTLSGSIDLLKSAVESAQIKFVKEFTPAMRGVIDAVAGVVAWIANLPGPLKILFGVILAGIPAVIGLVTAWNLLSKVLAGAGGPIAIVVTAIALVIAGIAALVDAFDTLGNSRENLEKSTATLRDTVKEMREVDDQLTSSTIKLTAAEKSLLEQRADLLKQNMAFQIQTQTKAINQAADAMVDLNIKIRAQEDLYNSLATTGTATRDMYQAAFGAAATFGGALQDQGTRILPKLEEELLANKQAMVEQNAVVNDGTVAIAEAIEQGYLQIAQVKAADPILAGRVERLIQERKETSALTAEQKKAADEAEAKRLSDEADLAAAQKRYNLAIERARTLVENEKSELAKLREAEAELSSFRGNNAVDEATRREALLILNEKITDAINKQNKVAVEATEEYNQKLAELEGRTRDKIALEQEAARRAIEASTADIASKEKALASVDAYYDKLRETTAQDEFKANMDSMWKSAVDGGISTLGALQGLFSAMTEARVAELDRQLLAELEAAGVAEDTAVEKAQKELDTAITSGDAEVIADKQKLLKKAQIEQDYERKKAQVAYQGQSVIWGLTLAQAIAEGARAIVQATASAPWPFNIPAIAFATAITGIQLATIAASKPQKPAFQTGGIVIGPPGVDAVDAKLTAGEIVMNKDQQARLMALLNGTAQLQAPATQGGSGRLSLTINVDGQKLAEAIAPYYNNGVTEINI